MYHKNSIKHNTFILFFILGLVFSLMLFSSENRIGSVEPLEDLAEIFHNRLVVDTNNDNIPDDISAGFLIPPTTAAGDIEAAAAIAARLGFESIGMDPLLTVSSWKEAKKMGIKWLVTFSAVKPDQQLSQPCGIRIYNENGLKVIDVFGVSPQARKYAAINFFSRHPYIWDITGRDTGELWFQVKKDVISLFPDLIKKDIKVRIVSVHYRYSVPTEKDVNKRRLERLGLSGTLEKKGEVESAEVELLLPPQVNNGEKYIVSLIDRHKRGEDTHILNFSGLREVNVRVISTGEHVNKQSAQTVSIPRTTIAQRFLNPTTDPSFYKKKVTIADTGTDIAGFFSSKGIYKDTDADGFPDKLVSRIVYEGSLTDGLINLAARIGLEDCVISLPFILPAQDLDLDDIKNLEHPVFIGFNNRFSRYLEKVGKATILQLKEDEGLIRFSTGFNPGGAFIISGKTSCGENTALQYIAETLPFISPEFTQPGAPIWEDLNREVEMFFSRKNDAGIATWGIAQLDRNKNAFSASDLEQAKAQLFTMRHVDHLEQFIESRIQMYQSTSHRFVDCMSGEQIRNVSNNSTPTSNASSSAQLPSYILKTGGRLEAGDGFSDKYTPQWEVDEAREIFSREILPQLQKLATDLKENLINDKIPANSSIPMVFIDLRLSEPIDILLQQADWIKEQLVQAGLPETKFRIQTITAYKQGFHWIKDCILPQLKSLSPAAIKIRFSPNPLDWNKTAKYRPEPVRWLQELYPIDEIIEREVKVPLKKIQFIKDDSLKDSVYEFIAEGKNGDILFRESFTPFTVEIPFQPRFKEWGNVVVSNGGFRVEWQGKSLFSCTIDTDPLRLWKHYQNIILPKLTEMAEKQAGGSLKLEDQPFFSKLQTDVWMSEPDYRLDLDEEMVSSLESFHEDLYFNTLDYFQSFVKKESGMDSVDPLMAQRWAAPGNIIPIIHADGIGKPPVMETEVTGLEALAPKVEMEFKYCEFKEPVKITQKISALSKMLSPRLTGIIVDNNGIAREAIYNLNFSTEDELSDAADMLNILTELQKEKIFTHVFSYPGVSNIRFILSAPDNLQTHFVLNLTQTVPGHASLVKKDYKSLSKEELDEALSQIIDPVESLDLAKRLGTFPEIDQYVGGYSYQGRPVPILEIGLESGGKLISRRKLTTYKPTVFLLGRQHANEVSSTNYAYNIAWLLAKEPGYRKYLEHLNIVIEPMENPDGSALAVKLQKITPYHMLHAGRYSALGTDIGYNVNKVDTLITEARVRKNMFDRWLPDIFLNNHGYPSHEWVQQFSHYTPYLFRAYWIPRGWYYFHTGLDTIGTPFHKKAGEEIVNIISNKMKGDTDIFSANKRIYDRYRRWAERWQPHIHYLELYNGTNIYKKRRGTTAPKHTLQRDITVLEAIPEAMDETAHNNWLELAIRQGTLFVTSFFDLALEAEKPIERIEEENNDAVNLQILRHRPLRTKD